MKKLIFVIVISLMIGSCNQRNFGLSEDVFGLADIYCQTNTYNQQDYLDCINNRKVCDVSIRYNCLDNQSEVMLVGFTDFARVDANNYKGIHEIGVLYCPENQTFQIKNQNVTMCY